MRIKKMLAVLLTFVMLLGCASTAFAAYNTANPAYDAHLSFNEDGKFRIVNYSDFQDDETLSTLTAAFIRKSMEELKPDLVVLTGDNIAGYSCANARQAKRAIAGFMDIFQELYDAGEGAPVAAVFGNHDDQDCGYSKEEQMAQYMTYSCFVGYDEGDAVEGVGNYNVPIFSSTDPEKIAFNVWMWDSGTYDETNGGYDHIKPGQIAWYKETSDALKAANGGEPVYSLSFQHIIPREIFDALEETGSGNGAVGANGTFYRLPDTAVPGSVLGEGPCPGTVNGGQFQAFLDQGDVLGTVSGHDHVNTFIVPYQGIDIINTPTAGFHSYGNAETRGLRVFDLDESDTSTYKTEIILYEDMMEDEPTMALYKFINFFKEIAAWFSTMWTRIKSAFGS